MKIARKSCPICSKPSQHDVRPFCSPKCQAKDLLAWAGEGYVLPGNTPIEGLAQPDDGADHG